jgi:integrase
LRGHPRADIRLPRVNRAPVVPLTAEEIRSLTEGVAPRYRALILVGAAAGLRQGEALGLTVERIDFLRRTITVDRQLVLLPGGPPRFGPPKTASSHRVVPVPKVLTDALAAHLAEFGAGPGGLVFTGADGHAIRRNRCGELIAKGVRASNLRGATTFHDLRHFYASLLIRHGESVKTVQARMGHGMAQETLDTYGHLWPDSEDRTRAAVEEVLGLGEPADADSRQ